MVNFGENAKIKKAGNLNSGCSYLIKTVISLIKWTCAIIKTIMYHLFSRLRSLVTRYPVAQVGSMYVVVKLKEDY